MTETLEGGEWDEGDLIPLSALQHFAYCPRQCALIRVEQVFDENIHTLRGRDVHRLVDVPEGRIERGVRVERALPLFSHRLGLTGKGDVVEFLADGTPYPVEYKHGRRRVAAHDDLQLAAQALCLEEMMGISVPAGAIYHHTSRRRREVAITAGLRQRVAEVTAAVRKICRAGILPPPLADERCRNCAQIDACQPHMVADTGRLHALRSTLFEVEDDP